MALLFDGSGDYAQAGIQQYNNNAQISISMWLYIPSSHSNAQYDRMFELGGYERGDNTASSGTHSGGVGIEIHGITSQFSLATWNNVASSNTAVITYLTDQWFHILITSDTSGPSNKMYVDGASALEDTSLTRSTEADIFTIAASNDAPAGNQGEVRIAELAIWHGVILNTSDRDTLNASAPDFVRRNNLVGYWPLIGTNAIDKILAETLTVTNAVKFGHPRMFRHVGQILQFPPVAAVGGVTVDSWYTVKENPVLDKIQVVNY